jgi:hypothetical protein
VAGEAILRQNRSHFGLEKLDWINALGVAEGGGNENDPQTHLTGILSNAKRAGCLRPSSFLFV